MANTSKRPTPPARMAELLDYERGRLLRKFGEVREQDFDDAWEECWSIMVSERAWPHFTPERRGWREAMLATKGETKRWFLGQQTSLSAATEGIRAASDFSRSAGGVLDGALVG